MKAFYRNLILTLFGAVTSILTAILLTWIAYHCNFYFYSLSVWFIIPVGAIGSGFVAAGGYYLGAIVSNQKPTKLILVNMVLVSVGTYFLVQYLNFVFINNEGRHFFVENDNTFVSAPSSFWSYWFAELTHTSVSLMAPHGGHTIGRPIELGKLGYLDALLQIIGFAIGGAIVFTYLESLIFCDKCSVYFSKKGVVARYTDDWELVKKFWEKVVELFYIPNLQGIIVMHDTDGGEIKYTHERHMRTEIDLRQCKSCKRHYMGVTVSNFSGREWKPVEGYSFATYTETDLNLVKR